MPQVWIRSASGSNVTLSDNTVVGAVPVQVDNHSKAVQDGLSSGQIAQVSNSVVEILLGLARITQQTSGGGGSKPTNTIQGYNGVSVPASAWAASTPINSADGYKTLVANFNWASGYSMSNSSNYAVSWFMDLAGTQQVATTQWGSGQTPYSSQAVSPIPAPYFSMDVKNTDTVAAHTVNAWAYLQPF